MSEGTRVSIAMAVYNGERFLQEQLDSFVRQTRAPDELVVSDNASTDRTVEVLRDFAAHAPFPVRIFINDRNLGVSKNFERAIQECTGDIIFLSDCDDVWYLNKVAAMTDALVGSPRAGVVICPFDYIDEKGASLGKTVVDVYGCSMAFKATFKPLVLPFPDGRYFQVSGHDAFTLWCICGVGGELITMPEPLLGYRQHPQQTSKALPKLWQTRHQRPQHLLGPLTERLRSKVAARLSLDEARRNAQIRHWERRLTLPSRKLFRLPVVARELISGRYHAFSRGFMTAFKDLLLVR